MSPRRVLCGRYTVGEVIGRGVTADVPVGRDTRSGRWVAIKTLRQTLAEDPLLRSSFQREAQTMGRLHHHAIVALHDTGHDAGSARAFGNALQSATKASPTTAPLPRPPLNHLVPRAVA